MLTLPALAAGGDATLVFEQATSGWIRPSLQLLLATASDSRHFTN